VEYPLAVPLVMQFFIAFTATAIFNINSTLMIDLYPSKPASATAIVGSNHSFTFPKAPTYMLHAE
jgi:uncharacterized protein involved in exopolysaccharide biosynthesis